jgi:hypothetical protein
MMTEQFYNPYEDRVVQQTIDDIMEAGDKQDIAARAQAISAGGESAFGSRARLGAEERRESLGRGLAEALGNIRSRGFSEAQQTGMGEFARQRQAERAAASGLGGFAGSRLGAGQSLAGNLQQYGQSAAGANTTYTVTDADVLGDSAYDVSVNGLVKEPTVDYTVDPDTDTLTIIPSLAGGEDIVIIQRGLGIPLTQGTIGTTQIDDGAVTTDKLANTAVTAAKILDGAVTNAKLATPYSHPNHTGDVTSTGDGATVIADDAVTADKISSTDVNFNVSGTGKVGIGTSASNAHSLNVDGDILVTNAGNVSMELGGGTGFTAFIDLKNPSTDDYDVRVISDDSTAIDVVHNSRARVEGHNSLGLCAGDTSGGTPIPEVVTVRPDYILIKDTTGAPSGDPTGGGYLYVESGALKFKGSSGTVTTIAVA